MGRFRRPDSPCTTTQSCARATLQQQAFGPVTDLEADHPFRHSLGAYLGVTSRVQLRFHPRIAAYIKERSWHPSQRLKDRPDGSVVITLDVRDDYALRSWIFVGRSARVLAPEELVDWMAEELDHAARQYASTGLPPALDDDDGQPGLPFLFERVARPAEDRGPSIRTC